MIEKARRWRILMAGTAAAVAGVVGLAGNTASAEPLAPQPSLPGPATVTQTVTVIPNAAPALPAQHAQPVGVAAGTPAAAAGALPATAPATALSTVATTAVPQPVQVPITPAASGTVTEFLRSKGVQLEPQSSRDFTALNVVLPMPPGWSQVPDPNVPDAFAVIADRVGGDGLYTSNAQVVLYKLIGEFDAREAISHGLVDSQQLSAWRSTDGSIVEVNGVPTSVIEGTYRENNMTLNTSRRHLIATSGPDRYLVSLSVTTAAAVSVASGDATDAILNGFRVTSPTQLPPPAAPPAAPASAPAPAGPLPQVLGLPG